MEPLPLSLFDDSDYEVRSLEDWRAMGERVRSGLPARGLYMKSNGCSVWRDCFVTGHEPSTGLWQVVWTEGSTKEKEKQLLKHRMEVYFKAEDPFNFADRLADAQDRRLDTERAILYNLYVDCMPSDDLAELNSDEMNRIIELCMRSRAINQASADAHTLMDEVNVDYQRTMNKIILASQVGREGCESCEGCQVGGLEEFRAHWQGQFCFSSFLTKPEIIRIIVQLQAERLRVLSLSLFHAVSKSVRQEEFVALQAQATQTTSLHLKEQWTNAVVGFIRQNLKDEKKGWFNLDETNNEVYSFSKLRNFLVYINFNMQDTLQFLVEDSLKKFTRFILSACMPRVEIHALNDVRTTIPEVVWQGELLRAPRAPLFMLDIVHTPGCAAACFAYSHRLASFGEAILAAFDKGLASTQNIVRVERRVMKQLFWSHDPVMSSVYASEPWVEALRQELALAVQGAITPLEQYLATFDDFLDFLNLDEASYLAETEEAMTVAETGEFMFEDVRELSKRHHAQKEEAEAKIPENVVIGPFAISVSKVRSQLGAKHADISHSLLDMLAQKLKEQAQGTIGKFDSIYRQLHAPVHDVEGLNEMEEYIASCVTGVAELQSSIDATRGAYEVAASVSYRLDASTFSLEWEVFRWPQKVSQKIEQLEASLAIKQQEYQNEMEDEQEEFIQRLKGLQDQVSKMSQYTDIAKVDQVSSLVRRMEKELENCVEQVALFNSREVLFGKPVTEYELLDEIRKSFEPYCDLWKKVDDWMNVHEKWMTDPFLSLDSEEVDKQANTIFKSLQKVSRFFESNGLDGCLFIAQAVKQQVEDFLPFLPVITGLRTSGICSRHWDQLSEKLGVDLHPDESYTLTNVIEQKLHEQAAIITKVSETAGKEFAIESALDKMQQAWKDVPLVVEKYRDTGTSILKGLDECMALLDEHITMTQAMTFSTFKGPFEERIEDWNSLLQVVSEVLDEWLAVQRNWLYLQPIFDSPDINKQLPTEGKRFASVDKHWRATMSGAEAGAQCIKFCNNVKLLEKFRESSKLLDMVQKGLSDYLETKRAGFSRFYFLSNDELLEILSQTKDPLRVQPHLKKCFEGIKSVEFAEDLTIHAMNSSEGEKVPFVKPVDPNGKSIESWMVELCDMMKLSVREQMLQGVKDYAVTSRTDWMQNWPGQIVLNGSQVHWSLETEAAMRAKGNEGVIAYHKQLEQQLNDMVFLIRGQLSKMARITIGALAVIDVHARDVMQKMGEAGVSTPEDFDWYSQMRFYWKGEGEESPSSTGDLKVVMVSSERDYGYEYLGNSFRLVITPLTDKCYLTIMSALQMILGGAPAGPAGTGKTETTKDLAKALAKQCVVFNCSDGLDYLAMGKFFKGLASSGAWACFDEFNRINIEVLSVIAQQIMTLQGAVQRGEKRVLFEETDIVVNPEFAVFITMNPGYAGRSELPDNLEALFRPVAMMVPDYALIGEIMLFSYGYLENRKCAQKMTATFRLCSEQLSAQDHYDYGMRAVKTVITAAGNLKRANPDEIEEALLLRALQDVNVPKFLAHDLSLFDGILSDLFPGVERPPFNYGPLMNALKLAMEARNLQPVPSFVTKNVQLYEMICVRHGLMVVGPTGGGKSSNIHVLKDALSYLKRVGVEGERYEKVEAFHLNPKSITMGQLYGEFDENTHEWQDGILAGTVRTCARKTVPDLQWVLFDGPVDAIWIENMNTVLDDNKKLCLTSGEIMSLSEPMTMMFEPEDLAVASPATVSRCGMIYMEPRSLGIDPVLQSWLGQLPEGLGASYQTKLLGLFDTFVPTALAAMRRFCTEPLPTVDNCLVQGLMNILDCYLDEFRPVEGVMLKSADEMGKLAENLESLFFFALVWSVAATVDAGGRAFMDQFIRAEMESAGCAKPFPSTHTVYEYAYDQANSSWVKWMDTVAPYQHNSKLSFNEIIIPTTDSVRYTYLVDLLVKGGKHVLATGPTGTGKTVNINEYLQTGVSDAFVPVCLTFSAQTGANQTQDLIDGKCEKRRKGVFGPSAGKKFVLFVDDVNMPQREYYGAQPPIELLRQWFDSGGWYDRKSLQFRQIIDVIFVCACGPPGGGRNPVTARFYRHFSVLGYTAMEDESLKLIFGTILGNFMERFSDPCKELVEPIVNASINIYNTILRDLRPTPTKSHYTYNLRDLSKVFQGMLMMDHRRVQKSEELARLWLHESQRVFADRLTCKEDKEWFTGLLKERMDNGLKQVPWEEAVGTDPNTKVICGDFMVPGADPKIYEEIKDHANLQSTVEEYLQDYNSESKQPMQLVMFGDAIEHVARISRVIRQPMGNALLLGVGGSGRQSLTKLATLMADFVLFQIEISKNYGTAEWHDDLKVCLLKAGVEDKSVVFLFNDTQIVNEGMLEDVNNILNSGDVPNLYGPEEMDRIMNACKPLCAKKRIPATRLNVFAQYINRVRSNIHIVLCMSPLGEAFRTRLRMFPSIVNCCTVDWFLEWPDEALKSVADRSLMEAQLNLGDDNAKVVEMVKHIHQSVAAESDLFLHQLNRHNYVTPTSFLELLSTYRAVLTEKRKLVGTLKDRLQVGLDKIISTQSQASQRLQESLTAMEPVLIRTQAEVEEMIVQITKDKEEAAKTQRVVEQQEADSKAKAAATKEIADDAQRDLDEALPALDAAVACLKDLKKSDIDEVRALGKPPGGVKLTMEALCIMFTIKPEKAADPDNPGKKINDYFAAAKKNLLSNANKLLADMQNFDKDNIPDKVIKQIDPFMENPDFEPKQIEKASKACTAICMWVRAMHVYHNVALQVEPKRQLLAEKQVELDATLSELAAAQSLLKETLDKVAALEASFEEANAKKENLMNDVEECRARLDRAQKLIGGLGGEKDRWTTSVAQLEIDYNNLVGDALVSAGMVAYSGPFTPDFRQRIVKDWQERLKALEIPHSQGCDVRGTLADPVQIRIWTIAGLPSDPHSVENGIIMSKARRYPLLIDPQAQANRYIKNMGRDPNFSLNGIDVVKLTDKNFLRTLENGIRFGRWVLLENLHESLDAALEPLLLQQYFKQGGTTMIKVGDSTIPWNDQFKFFMTTKLSNPHYPPEVCVKVSLINFAITFTGLEDQLLGVVVVEEMPEMEEKKNSLVLANSKMKKELQEIENKILFLLSNSKGNILDDHELIETLASSKKTSTEITQKVAEAEVTEKEIDANREKYRPVAYRGSILYFCIRDCSVVDPMYQYSLQWFTGLFVQATRLSEKSDVLEERLEELSNFFTYYVYTNVCRSLFVKDKLLFSFLMTVRVLQGDKQINDDEWAFLISGCWQVEAVPTNAQENPAPDWIDARMWSELQAISGLPAFEGLLSDMQGEGLQAWKALYDHSEPQTLPLPGRWEATLDGFEKMCLLRSLRADKVQDAIVMYVMDQLGKEFVEPPPFDLNACYADSTVVAPLIFVLTKGSDPTKSFYQFAAQMRFDKKVAGLSLGQGQGTKAKRLIEAAMQKGTWVYLQNCHLYISWLSELERICEELTPESVHKDFRLWLTSMPCLEFPVSILQSGIKMTNEPPKGKRCTPHIRLKANLKSAYFKLSDAQLDATTKPDVYKKLLYALCFFHAVVQERRKFGPLGWNVPYEFNETDLDISRSQLEIFLDAYDEVPYKVLTFLTSYINYGGRVTDAIDLRTIDVIMSKFYTARVVDGDYSFDAHGIYTSISPNPAAPHRSYVEHIDSLPMTAGPGVFGMHENANIACALAETLGLFDTILKMEAGGSGGDGGGGDESIGAAASSMHKRVLEKGLFDIEAISMQYPVTYSESMNTVLVQECIRYNKLTEEILSTLPDLCKALKGLVVMSGDLEAIGKAVAVNAVPSTWEAKAYPSLKPLTAWIDDLLTRLQVLQDWIDHGTPSVYWISGFYFPQAFLTGTLQNFARKMHMAIDTVAFNFRMVDTPWEEVKEKPEDGAYIRGLFLEGARWNAETHSIDDSRPKQLYTPMPVVHLSPEQFRQNPTKGVYRLPVYKVLSRRGTLSTTGHSTNFIFWMDVPSNRKDVVANTGQSDQEVWVLAGVAAFASLRY
ncbi:unnamed protein product [Chrysoparadoxa australica]